MTAPKGLIKYFQNCPVGYVVTISHIYKNDLDTAQGKNELSENEVERYYDIIESFTTVPGCNEELVSEEDFRAWISTAQAYADAINCRHAFDSCLGRLLSYAREGEDGIFPHEIVRNYFEENQSSVLIDYFVRGKITQRGAYLVTAGVEEKKMAEDYRSSAEKLEILYPHTAAILRKLADYYDQESLYEQKCEQIDFS